jgi:L-2-hydroxyglutarate oxidase LhgO
MNTFNADITIIGAGVIGLAIASEVAEAGKDIIVLERHNSFGQETSSRNSEVLHAGMNYPPGTLKAELCVKGKQLLYEICEKNNIPYKKTGKLIIASEERDLPLLDQLLQQGAQNGVSDLEMWDAARIKRIAPNIRAFAALYSPSTGIVDSHKLMGYFFNSASGKGALISFGSDVTKIAREGSIYELEVKNFEENIVVRSRIVINCAGLDSDTIASLAGLDTGKLRYTLHYCKGQYFRASNSTSSSLNMLVYPAPRPKAAGLGIHATLDLGGGLRFGPDDEYLKTREKNYDVDESRKRDFYLSVNEFLPFIKEENLSPDTAGIRPKLQGPQEDFRDFIIKDEKENGFPNFIDLIGIESPGLTASAAIAKYTKQVINEFN